MLRRLLHRDWRLHKDALLLLGLIVLVMVPVNFLSHPEMEAKFVASLLGRIAFGLGCLLPFLVQSREVLQGTLGDILALPIVRNDLVNLRWFQALGCGSIFFLVVTLPALRHFSLRDLATAHASLTLPWVFLWVFAAQLPFQLRFGQKGGISFGVTIFLLEGWGFSHFPVAELPKQSPLMQQIIHALQLPQRGWAALGSAAPFVEGLLLGLLIWAAYRLALSAAERCHV